MPTFKTDADISKDAFVNSSLSLSFWVEGVTGEQEPLCNRVLPVTRKDVGAPSVSLVTPF